MTKRGVEPVGAGTLLVRLAKKYPDELREAHRRGADSRPTTEEQVFAILDEIIGLEATTAFRAVVTAEPEAQSHSTD